MNLNRKQKITLMHIVGYTTIAGIAFGVAFPIFGSGNNDQRIGGTQKISFLSNVPSWFDKSFNEFTYDGAVKYTAVFDKKLGTRGVEYSDDGTSYVQPIKNLFKNGAETIVTAGFSVAGYWSNSGAFEVLKDPISEDKSIFILDDSTLSWDVDDYYGDAVTLTYTAHEAGFFAGLASAIYAASLMYDTPQEAEDIYFGMWGGDQFDTVYDWMSGFEMAVNWFNYEYSGWDINGNKYSNNKELDGLGRMKITSGASKNLNIDYSKAASSGIESGNSGWYTGGFSSDGDPGKVATTKTDNMIKNDIKAIFPVAGPQVFNALNMITSSPSTKDIQVLGVDVDATLSASPETHNQILGSALKDVQMGTEYGLWYTDKYLNEYSDENWEPVDDIELKAKNDLYYEARGRDFITPKEEDSNGWLVSKTTNEDDEVKAAHFEGTYENGAVDFTDSGQPQLQNAIDNIGLSGIKTFNDLMDYAFNQQVQNLGEDDELIVIEKASWTFTDNEPGPSTTEEHNGYNLWIPDWSVYNRS